jgi:hypothetical protein
MPFGTRRVKLARGLAETLFAVRASLGTPFMAVATQQERETRLSVRLLAGIDCSGTGKKYSAKY